MPRLTMNVPGVFSKTFAALILLFGAIVLNIGLFRGESSLKDYFELKKSKETLSKTVNTLAQENLALDEEIMRLKKSKSYARKILRDKYHVTEPDENIIFFAD
jgi:cell division protein FtsB